MADEKGYSADLTPQSVDGKAIGRGLHPFDAWEFTKPGDATPTLTLKDTWTLAVAGDLAVTGDAAITGSCDVGSLTLGGTAAGLSLSGTDLVLTPGTSGDVTAKRVAGDTTQMLTWHLIADPGTDWFASKTSGWTGDSFSGGLEIDFSAVVPAGTKAVEVVFYQSTSGGITYWRKSGDANISNTPHASNEKSHIIARSESTAYYAKAILWLSDDYKVQIAVQDAGQDVYFSSPVAVLR
jgi:hypothetical protein